MVRWYHSYPPPTTLILPLPPLPSLYHSYPLPTTYSPPLPPTPLPLQPLPSPYHPLPSPYHPYPPLPPPPLPYHPSPPLPPPPLPYHPLPSPTTPSPRLQKHTDAVYVIETNPIDSNVLLTAGHDGYIVLWDLYTGQIIYEHYNAVCYRNHFNFVVT